MSTFAVVGMEHVLFVLLRVLAADVSVASCLLPSSGPSYSHQQRGPSGLHTPRFHARRVRRKAVPAEPNDPETDGEETTGEHFTALAELVLRLNHNTTRQRDGDTRESSPCCAMGVGTITVAEAQGARRSCMVREGC